MKTKIHCTHGDYDAPIGGPYGIPDVMVQKCIEIHETAHKGHRVKVVQDESQ